MNPEDIVNSLFGMFGNSQTLGYITRDIQFFPPDIQDLRNLKKEIEKTKTECIKEENENKANLMLSCECLVDAIICELQMWMQLKKEDPNAAWISLVTGQNHILSSISAADIPDIEQGDYYKKLEQIEKIIFPPQTYMSTGMVVEGTKCSLCDDDYAKCDHISGQPYMGQFCCQVVHKIKKMNEVSIVDHPFDKRCRVTSTKEGDISTDLMSGKILKSE